jgi:hypothetical protein
MSVTLVQSYSSPAFNPKESAIIKKIQQIVTYITIFSESLTCDAHPVFVFLLKLSREITLLSFTNRILPW